MLIFLISYMAASRLFGPERTTHNTVLLNRVVYRFSKGLANTAWLSSKTGRVGVGGLQVDGFGSIRTCQIPIRRASTKHEINGSAI